MKKLHLICNAHLDPIWQWDWQEGASAALATFYAAADLADKYDYIFCHNEANLYKYIEEYAPNLFERIRALVEKGKWYIMGGWYLQPDCNMPCGESLVRQILVGKEYFRKKFGKSPSVAVNFDSFGHSAGLPQVLAKCGQNGYIITRPAPSQCDIGGNFFVWEGVDGSRINVARCDTYNTPLGDSLRYIQGYMDCNAEIETGLRLWGVGNHGGGPSGKDLSDIDLLIGNSKEIEILHSTPEKFFADFKPQTVFCNALITCMPGCYTSDHKVKQMYCELENEYFLTEKTAAFAVLSGAMEYPRKELEAALEDLLNMQFHDVLPGTIIKSGERNALAFAYHGLLTCEKVKARAFFALAKAQSPAKPGEYPILVFNPNPYEMTTVVEAEFSLADQNWEEKCFSVTKILDENGEEIPSQMIKEGSTFSLDWRKRTIFEGKLRPMGITRFCVYIEKNEKKDVSQELVFEGKYYTAKIDKESGLLSSFVSGGKEYCADGKGFGQLVLWKDNADPWAMNREQQNGLGSEPAPFGLMKKPHGIFEGMKPVQVIEDGKICRTIEAFFEKEESVARVEYRFYRNMPYIDINVDLYFRGADRLVRMDFPLSVKGEYFGQTVYGTYSMDKEGKECVSQRFVGVDDGTDKNFTLFNKGVYGSRYKDEIIGITLVRGVGYCVHPIADRPLLPKGRFVPRMDENENTYHFRLAVCAESERERMATEFVQPVYALNVFPILGEMLPREVSFTVSNPDIVLTAFAKSKKGNYILRLFNNMIHPRETTVEINGTTAVVRFGRFEMKTVVYDGIRLTESQETEI